MPDLKVLIVEDEFHAREKLVSWMASSASVTEVRTAGSLAEARAVLASFNPDVLFLDIELGDGTSFDLLSPQVTIPIVFTTAYDVYAVRAFRVDAIDYIMKPFGEAEVELALERVKRRLSTNGVAKAPPKILKVKNNGVSQFIVADQIHLISSEDYYSAIHVGERVFLTRKSIADLASELAHLDFLRIHRSTIVNLKSVVSSRPLGAGGLELTLSNGQAVVASRSFASSVKERLSERAASLS